MVEYVFILRFATYTLKLFIDVLIPVSIPVKGKPFIVSTERLFMDTFDAFIKFLVIIVLPFAIVVKDIFKKPLVPIAILLNVAFEGYSRVVPDVIKIPFVVLDKPWLITELPLIFITFMVEFDIFTVDTFVVLIACVPEAVIAIPFTVNDLIDTLVKDAFDTFIYALNGIEKLPMTDIFVKLIFGEYKFRFDT